MEGQRMKKEKITKTYLVTRQATHTFPPKDKYLPPFGGLCEGGRRGRRQNWTQITTSSKETHTSLFSSATYVVPDTICCYLSEPQFGGDRVWKSFPLWQVSGSLLNTHFPLPLGDGPQLVKAIRLWHSSGDLIGLLREGI